MKENPWRTSLIERLRHRKDVFTWVNEVRAKRGFPDLTLIFRNGTREAVPACYELKVSDHVPKSPAKLFEPIQLHTLKRLRRVNCRAMGLVRLELRGVPQVPVMIYDPLSDGYRIFQADEFYERWLNQSAGRDLLRTDA